MHRRAVQVLHARLGLVSNNGALIRSPEYFTARVQQSLLTDYHAIQEIPYAPDLDAEIFIFDEKDAPPRLVLGEDRAVAVGDFTALEAGTPDKRYTLFGNLGLVLENPPLRIVPPKVESGRTTPIVTPIEPRERLVRLLFDSASEKHGQTVLLYECLPVPAADGSGSGAGEMSVVRLDRPDGWGSRGGETSRGRWPWQS